MRLPQSTARQVRVGAAGLTLLAVLILPPAQAAPPRNVILFIGDGMGFNHVLAARHFAGAPLSFEAFPHQTQMTTFSANSAITDSAASATAMATGFKVNNTVVSVALPGDGQPYPTVLEVFQSQAKRSGLVTTAYLTDATPAVFAAHTTQRGNHAEIASDYLTQSRPNVLLGGGGNGLSFVTASNAGYTVVTDAAGLAAIQPEAQARVAGLFGGGNLPYVYDGQGSLPSLPTMTDTALQLLAGGTNGFFLMVEGGRIDHAAHANDLARNVRETVAFSEAVQVVMNWASNRTDTLILVTADHETGGLNVITNNGPGQLPGATWSSIGHTATNVPIYAWGNNATLVTGVLDNTAIAGILIADVPPPPPPFPVDSLALWLDANDVAGTGTNPASGSTLATWIDKSGSAHHATQAVASNRPTLLSPGVGSNAVVRFDGGDWLEVGTLRTTPGNLHAFVVSQRTAGQLGGSAANTYQRLVSTSDGTDTYDWQAPDWTITSRYDGSGIALTYGPDVRRIAHTNASLSIVNLTLGRDAANGFSRLSGDLAEVLVFTNALDDTAVAAVTNYLNHKWLANTNAPPVPRPLVGVIRWDAWIGDAYGVGRAVHKSLGPAHWHSRLPYFGYALSPTQVVVQSITQLEEDRQNAFAQAAGIDYWAFVMYSTNDPMTRFGIDLYQSSPHRDAIQFCMINQGETPARWQAFQDRMLTYFAMSNHVTVLGNRPLFYLFNPPSLVQPGYFASWADARAAFEQLRAATTNAGLGNPYLVVLEFDPATGKTEMDNLGFDALSSYAVSAGHTAATFATLDAVTRNRWDAQRNTGAPVIPNATTGWDRRPRVENPVPWESWQSPGVGIDQYYAAPTPAELTSHLHAAFDWVNANAAATPARTILVYAWNEIDEGGWLLPTHTERTARLEAVRAVTGAAIDHDADDMDDLWEVWHFGSATNSAGSHADADADGFPDRSEHFAGTDPTNAQSLLQIQTMQVEPDQILFDVSTVSNRSYRIAYTERLTAPNWQPLDPVTTTNAITAFAVLTPDGPTSRFYRVELFP